MDITAKRELARVLVGTWNARHGSYDSATKRHTLDWDTAVAQTTDDPDLRQIVPSMLIGYGGEKVDWAERFLASNPA